jgi:hypothetical protein
LKWLQKGSNLCRHPLQPPPFIFRSLPISWNNFNKTIWRGANTVGVVAKASCGWGTFAYQLFKEVFRSFSSPLWIILLVWSKIEAHGHVIETCTFLSNEHFGSVVQELVLLCRCLASNLATAFQFVSNLGLSRTWNEKVLRAAFFFKYHTFKLRSKIFGPLSWSKLHAGLSMENLDKQRKNVSSIHWKCRDVWSYVTWPKFESGQSRNLYFNFRKFEFPKCSFCVD